MPSLLPEKENNQFKKTSLLKNSNDIYSIKNESKMECGSQLVNPNINYVIVLYQIMKMFWEISSKILPFKY